MKTACGTCSNPMITILQTSPNLIAWFPWGKAQLPLGTKVGRATVVASKPGSVLLLFP